MLRHMTTAMYWKDKESGVWTATTVWSFLSPVERVANQHYSRAFDRFVAFTVDHALFFFRFFYNV